ncbi:MAG: isochorismatase family protein [Polyangiaceae bacterium]|nr:isochorismatase family protein [Polyangiaceae bacterium]
MKRFDPSSAVLVIIDIQERLAPAMPEERMVAVKRSAEILLQAARLWEMPVLLTEQYPQGLGPTIASISDSLLEQSVHRFEKVEFSACDAFGFDENLKSLGKDWTIVIGMETHVCIFQTVRDLCERGHSVLLPVDGVVSRREDHRELGLKLCQAEGARLTTTETLVFDGLRRAGTPEFRALSKFIR